MLFVGLRIVNNVLFVIYLNYNIYFVWQVQCSVRLEGVVYWSVHCEL